jgi:hypothetical protein
VTRAPSVTRVTHSLSKPPALRAGLRLAAQCHASVTRRGRPPSERAGRTRAGGRPLRCDPPPAKACEAAKSCSEICPPLRSWATRPEFATLSSGVPTPLRRRRWRVSCLRRCLAAPGRKARKRAGCIVRVQLYAAPRRMHRTGRRVIERERTGSGSSVGGGRAHGVDACARRFAVELARALVP